MEGNIGQTCQVCVPYMVYHEAFGSLVELFQRLVVNVEWRPPYDLITVKISPKLHCLLLIKAIGDIGASKALIQETMGHTHLLDLALNLSR